MTDAPAPEAEPTALVLDLSGEELTFLLNMLGVAEIPGFIASGDMDDLIRTVVRHSLAARGAIGRNEDGDWAISELITAAVTAGLRSNHFVAVRRDADNTISEEWLYVLPSVVVQYSRPADYVHRFQAVFTPEALIEVLAGTLELAAPETVEPVSLTYPVSFFDVRRLAREGRIDEAHSAADYYGLPDDLRAAVIAPLTYAAFSATSVRGGRAVVVGGLAVTTGQIGQYWLLTPDGESVLAEKADSAEVLRRVGDLLQP